MINLVLYAACSPNGNSIIIFGKDFSTLYDEIKKITGFLASLRIVSSLEAIFVVPRIPVNLLNYVKDTRILRVPVMNKLD